MKNIFQTSIYYDKVVLPKQWKYWCEKNNLKPHTNRSIKPQHVWFYLKGHGYVWRVNYQGEFQLGDKLAEFDRWALCNIDSVQLPKSEEEFSSSVSLLLEYRRKQEAIAFHNKRID